MKNYLKELRTNAWRTSSARYNAARRLKRRETFSTISLALFSVASVGVAFLQHIYPQAPSSISNYFTALSICLGVLILALSLIEWGAANGAKAEVLHRNAEELNEFQHKLAFHIARLEDQNGLLTWSEIHDLTKEYETIKARCPYNHQPIDDKYFRASKYKLPEFQREDDSPCMAKCRSIATIFWWNINSIWFFSILWIAIVFLFIYGINITLPK